MLLDWEPGPAAVLAVIATLVLMALARVFRRKK